MALKLRWLRICDFLEFFLKNYNLYCIINGAFLKNSKLWFLTSLNL